MPFQLSYRVWPLTVTNLKLLFISVRLFVAIVCLLSWGPSNKTCELVKQPRNAALNLLGCARNGSTKRIQLLAIRYLAT